MIKKSDVKIGGMYIAKVTNRLVHVRIDSESRYGGWNATNILTNKPIRVKSAQRLRGVADVGVGSRGKKTGPKNESPKNEPDPQLAQTSLATVENAAEAESTIAAYPNCDRTEADEDGDCANCHEPNATKETSKAKRICTPKEPKEIRPGGLDAAAKVLEETGVPMNVKEITEVAFAKGYWKPAGRTPSATLASALMREIAKKGNDARFRKSERGKFVLNR